MKQDRLMDALQYIDDVLLESAADSMTEKKRYTPWVWFTATAACLAVLISVWAWLGKGTDKSGTPPILQKEPVITVRPMPEEPLPAEPLPSAPQPSEPQPSEPVWDDVSPIDPVPSPPSNQDPDQPEGIRPPPVEVDPSQIPKYDGALFTAQQLGALFPPTLGGTVVYEQIGFPENTPSGLSDLPNGDYINIYQSTDSEAVQEETVLGIMYDILPRLEQLLEAQIPISGLDDDLYASARVQDKWITVSGTRFGTIISCSSEKSFVSADLTSPALQFNGITLSAKRTDNDQQVMETLSAVIPYLEELFDMDLSAHKIYREYADDGDFYSMTVYLYSKDHVTDLFQEQYDDYPRRYIAGEVLCLNFSREHGGVNCDTVVCREIEFISQPQRWFIPTEQRKMLSLAEAEELLAQGYVFSFHVCKLCMQAQDKVDFTDYDRVSLEYVYGDDYGIPFYAFYKKLEEYDDGSVRYAKTMVPAVEVMGLEEYFEDQIQYHQPSSN